MRKPVAGPAPLIWTQPPPPPRQRSLGREEIVAAAIALADEAGPAALTMKAVAGRLGPYSAMALYRYVHSKEGLVDLMLDTATAEVPLPGRPGPDWRADLEEVAGQTRQMTIRPRGRGGAADRDGRRSRPGRRRRAVPPADQLAGAAVGAGAAGAVRAGARIPSRRDREMLGRGVKPAPFVEMIGLYGDERRPRAVPHQRAAGGPRRPAGPAGPDPVARRAARSRLGLRHPAGLHAGAGRVLAHRLRLAGARGPAERVRPVHDHD